MYTPDKMDSIAGTVLTVVALANQTHPRAGTIALLCVVLWLMQYIARHSPAMRDAWRALFDALRGIETAPPSAPARSLAHHSEPLNIETAPPSAPARSLAHHSEPLNQVSISVPVPTAPPIGPYLDDNPWAPPPTAPETAGMKRLHDIANDDNILVVGPKGSGKTTVLRALIRIRRGEHLALDPHNEPGKWPCNVEGGGRNFGAIDEILQGTYHGLNRRYQQLNSGTVKQNQFKRHTLVGDEWRAISQELTGEKPRDGTVLKLSAGAVQAKVLTEGRKVGLCVLAGAHNDTAASMGMAGDMALLACYDWIVYLGALAVRKMPAAARMAYPAVAYHPERDTCYLLDVNDAAVLAGPIVSTVSPAIPGNDPLPNVVTNGNAGNGVVTASGSDVTTSLPVTVTTEETAKIAVLLVTLPPSEVVKRLDGYSPRRYAELKAKVEYVQMLVKGIQP